MEGMRVNSGDILGFRIVPQQSRVYLDLNGVDTYLTADLSWDSSQTIYPTAYFYSKNLSLEIVPKPENPPKVLPTSLFSKETLKLLKQV